MKIRAICLYDGKVKEFEQEDRRRDDNKLYMDGDREYIDLDYVEQSELIEALQDAAQRAEQESHLLPYSIPSMKDD